MQQRRDRPICALAAGAMGHGPRTETNPTAESAPCGVASASRRLLLFHGGRYLADNAESPSLGLTWFDSQEIARDGVAGAGFMLN